MTVTMLRDHGVAGRRLRRRPLAGRARPGRAPSTTTSSPTCPTPRPFLAAGRGHRRPGRRARLAAAHHQAGDALREILTRMGCRRRRSTDDGPRRVAGTGAAARHRPRPARRRRARPRRSPRSCALADSPVAPARHRAHPRPRDRPARRARHRARRASAADVTEHARRARASAPRPLHGGVFHTYADHRMAHAGVVLGAGRRRRAGRGRRHHRQDLPRLRRRLGRRPVSRARADEPGARTTRRRPGALRPPAAPHPPAHQGAPDVRRRRRRPWSSTVDRGRYTAARRRAAPGARR